MPELPKIIQGGMGAGVSSWRLARAVSTLGQLGVVSGTALDVIVARRMQDGDRDGSIRHALERFPFRAMAERFVARYFIDGGKPHEQPYAAVPMPSVSGRRDSEELSMIGNFVEVFLAREGHERPVGINYLEKIQLPLLPSIYGAMLAGAAFVLVGAGIPLKIPGVLDRLAAHEPATYELTVQGADAEPLQFDPRVHADGEPLPALQRPRFLSIVASTALATTMLRRADGRVDGFVVETPVAGGHNAPPRGKLQLDPTGQPLYGEKDRVNLAAMAELPVPFWLAGGYGTPRGLRDALAAGAAGVQVGTAFAFCDESGLHPAFRQALLQKARDGSAAVFTDPCASPTGYPFKVAQLEATLSDPAVYRHRARICDLGYLRQAYRTSDGAVAFRCPAETVEAFVMKGGSADETLGRKCLCNALVANIGHAQRRNGGIELPLITAGDDLHDVARFIRPGETSYSARDVVETVLGARSGRPPDPCG